MDLIGSLIVAAPITLVAGLLMALIGSKIKNQKIKLIGKWLYMVAGMVLAAWLLISVLDIIFNGIED